MRKDNFILVVDQTLRGDNYYDPYSCPVVFLGRVGLLLNRSLSAFIPEDLPYQTLSWKFEISPFKSWGIIDYEKVSNLSNNLYDTILPVDKYIIINMDDAKFNYPQNINKDLLATKEQQEFFNNKIVLKEDCEYLSRILDRIKEKNLSY